MRPGVRLAVDVGAVRIGVAASDAEGRLAVPVETIQRGKGDLARIHALLEERHGIEVVVGWPVRMDGTDGPAVANVLAFAQRLAAEVAPVPVRAIDERLTTATAQRAMTSAGRSVKQSRSVIDQQAAVEILDTALSAERAAGAPAGRIIAADGTLS